MIKTSWITLLALTILLAPPAYSQTNPASPVQNPPLPKAIEQVDALATAEDKVGGTTIGIVSGGKLVWTKSYGYADTKNKVPTTKDHVFGIASITKQFTALMLLQLVEQGKVHLSDPVEKYVPEVNKLRNQFVGAPPITLIQLATHTSGLDRNPNDDKLVYGEGPVSEWDKKLIGTIPLTRFIYEPGTRYSYSNIGYAILGLALSRAAGEPYVDYVHNRILKPLKMSHTSFLLDDQMEKNRARGFLIENGKTDAEEPERQIRAGGGWRVPNGGLYSTVEDLARFVAFELGEEHTDVLSKKSLEANFERVNSALTEFTYGYGIGFQIRRRGNFIAIGHDGVTAGYQCSAWIDRTTHLGVITLTTKQEQFLGFRALEILANANRPVSTSYIGGYGVPGAFSYTQLDLVDTGGVVTGKMRQQFDRSDTPPLQNVMTKGEKLSFNVDQLYFDLHRTAHGYAGFARTQDGREQTAEFIQRLPPVSSEILAAYEGTYQIDRGRILTLSRNSGNPGFWYLELPSGRTGYLYNLSNSWPNIEFTSGPCIFCIKPEYLHVRFEQEHGEIGKTLQVQLGGRRYTARRLTSYREEEVTFTSADGTRLSGSLFIPAGKSPHPAVVFAHGSNAQTRNGFMGHIRFVAEAYARRGIAALAFDKRGTGKSQGDWDNVLFDTLAADVAAGVHYLRTRPDIRPDRIGLTGSSQAGVIMPIAASLVPDVRFIQVRSGGVLGVREQERRRIILQMKADNYPQSEIDRALRMRDMMDDYAVNGKNWEALEAYAKTVENEYWMTQFIGGFPAKNANDWWWLREAFGYQLGPYYSRFRGSWHILFADLDTATPTKETKIQTEIALREGNSRDITIEVVPGATHDYMLARTGADREFPGLTRFVPGFYDKVVGWAVLRMR